jgi:chemotaxis protein methyltransferase CheR
MIMKLSNEDIEIKLLIETIRLKYGYDFSQYALASLTRRFMNTLSETRLKKLSEMIPLLLYNKDFFNKFMLNISVKSTEMFRDPLFFSALRNKVIPYLRSFPIIKIWSAGIATGEEIYSIAILLKEEGLYDKSIIYATDLNDAAIDVAKKGIYPASEIKKFTQNYQKAGGKRSLSDYYYADYNSAIFDRSLIKNIVFSNYNLVSDQVFGEMNLIFCRNVMIYFNKELQDRVLKLLSDSLCYNGFLCLGSKESLEFSTICNDYIPFDKEQKIYHKKTANKGGELE